MQIRLEPPIAQWPTPTTDRPVWTGHQLSFFHPGIMAKYLAAEAASESAGVSFSNVVVDQDVYDPLTLTLPRRDPQNPDRLVTEKFSLGRVIADVPVGMQPAVDVGDLQKRIEQLPADVGIDRALLCEAFAETDGQRSLAAQMDAALRKMLPTYAKGGGGAGGAAYASELLRGEAEVLDRLLHDAPRCARLYNEAVRQFPGAGMSAMSIEPDRVEVPMWALRWMKPRQRVYVDVADSSPMFVTENGEPVQEDATLAPRALLMTALLRRPDRCALFIHGTGGWNYDRITERWWQAWQNETLCPMALATADVFLDFEDVPSNRRDELERAVWFDHHLPHNVDRVLGLPEDDPRVRAKRELLAHMDDDRDKPRRRSAFALLQKLNAELAARYPDAIGGAERAVERARVGVDNAAIAGRRDWSLLLYRPGQFETLRERLAYPPNTGVAP